MNSPAGQLIPPAPSIVEISGAKRYFCSNSNRQNYFQEQLQSFFAEPFWINAIILSKCAVNGEYIKEEWNMNADKSLRETTKIIPPENHKLMLLHFVFFLFGLNK